MLTETVINHWGSVARAAKALGISHKAPRYWGAVVPPWIAFRAYWASDGELLIDPELYRDYVDYRVNAGRRRAKRKPDPLTPP